MHPCSSGGFKNIRGQKKLLGLDSSKVKFSLKQKNVIFLSRPPNMTSYSFAAPCATRMPIISFESPDIERIDLCLVESVVVFQGLLFLVKATLFSIYIVLM